MGASGSSLQKPEGKEKLGDFTVKDIDGGELDLSRFNGKVVLVVNVASKCGYTADSYAGFKELAQTHPELVIVGFPCNQFLKQESGQCVDIKRFADSQGFKGHLTDKVNVNGKSAVDVYDFLKVQSGNKGNIKWNFTKFLVAKDGKTVQRFGTTTPIKDLLPHIDELLKQTPPTEAA